MKKLTLLFIMIAILSVPLVADAGIGDFLSGTKDFVLDHAIETILSLVFGVVAVFFGGSKIGKIILKSRIAVEGFFTILNMIRSAEKIESDGGMEITSTEWKDIIAEIKKIAIDMLKSLTGKQI